MASQTSRCLGELFDAVSEGDASKVEMCLSGGVDINGKECCGLTALHWATLWCRMDMVKTLLEKGADVHGKSKGGCTPLNTAIDRGATKIAEHLI